MDEESAYERAAVELETNQVDKATWARAFADADGDADKTKARYIALRIKKLTGEVQAQVAPIPAIQPQTEDAGHGAAPDSGGKLETEDERKARLWKEAQEQENGHRLGGMPPPKFTTEATHSEQVKQTPKAHDLPHTSGAGVADFYEAVIGGKNASYYLRKFAEFDLQGPGLKPSWNWPALFFTFAWTLYRRMYGWSFIYFVVYLLWSISGRGIFVDLAFFAFAIVFAVFANSLYHRHVTSKISSSKLVTGSYQAQLNHLHGVGGTHAWVIWVAVGIPLVGILAAIVIPAQQPSTIASVPGQQASSGLGVANDVSHNLPSGLAQDTVSAISGWVLVEKFVDADVYADSASISRTGDRVDMWSLVDYETAVVDEQSDPYKSFLALSSYDCHTSQIKVRSIRAYAQNMGRGGQVMAYSDPSAGWSVVTSQDVSRWKYVCGQQ